jgi:uncharacterized protein (DUF305 family)
MARFLNRSAAGRGRSLKGIAPAAAALLVLASSVQAGPSAPGTGSGTAAPTTALPPGSGRSGMPMGQRSADAHFIVMMIPHHEGAIAMAELALQRSKRPEIQALAQRIRTSQSQENAQMRRWYRQWYASDVPTWPGQGMGMRGGMEHRPSRAAGAGGGDGAGAERGDRADVPLVPTVVRHSEPLKPPEIPQTAPQSDGEPPAQRSTATSTVVGAAGALPPERLATSPILRGGLRDGADTT